MVRLNPVNVVRLLMISFDIGNNNESPINEREKELHDIIRDMIIRSSEDISFSMESDFTLEFLNPFRPHSTEFVDDTYSPTREELLEPTEIENEQCVPEEGGIVTLQYKVNTVTYWKSGKRQRHSLESVRHRFRKVSSLQQLYRWEETINRGWTRREKLLQISEYVYNKFVVGVKTHAIIHDLDLRRWALEANEEVDLENIKASRHWIWNFKETYRIVSRKVNKFITRSYGTDITELNNIASTFVNNVKPCIRDIGKHNTYNADENGFTLEIHSGRTLAPQGTKAVETVVQAVSATTHSYTVLPIISASVKLLRPLFLVLKEQSGTFGPHVQESLFRPWNIYITASKSGKLTKELFSEWFTGVIYRMRDLEAFYY